MMFASWFWYVRRALVVTAVLVAMTAPLQGAPPRGKKVVGLEEKGLLVQWGLAALFTGGCLAIAFKNSKRSHLN
jgi:hypothetical protein